MKPVVYEEAGKIWRRISSGAMQTDLKFELEVYRDLLNFFQVGDYYYYIFNAKLGTFDFLSNDITRVLGYLPEELDVPLFLSYIHPEDQPYFLNFENKVTDFFSLLPIEQVPVYKVRYDYRVRKKDGNYIRVLQQVVVIQHVDRTVLRTFGVHTDITHLKPEGRPVLSLIGLDGAPSYINVDVKEKFCTTNALITTREQQVLQLLAQGKSSNEIGALLFISNQTVITHRKNMLRKTGCFNTAALIAEAVKMGWI